MPNPDKRVLLLKLGQDIFNYHSLKYPLPHEHTLKITGDPQKLRDEISCQTNKVVALLKTNNDYAPLRRALLVHDQQFMSPNYVGLVCLAAYHNMIRYCEQTPDSIAHQMSVLLDDDLIVGTLMARKLIALLLKFGVLVMSEQAVRINREILNYFCDNDPLCSPQLNEQLVRQSTQPKSPDKKTEPPPPAKQGAAAMIETAATPLSLPNDLYAKLTQYVLANDAACRSLSVRGYLHLSRRELLQRGTEAGANECILLIGQSGTGKTYLAETFGRLIGLPFASLSASNFTASGYCGLDADDALLSLVRSAGEPKDQHALERARFGVLFMDEWDKRKTNTGAGIDVGGSGVQHEWLRLISGTKLLLGARRADRAEHPVEFNSNGTFFVFAGAFTGLESIIKNLAKECSTLGFSGGTSPKRIPKLYDALLEFGMVPEFLNRVTAIIAMKPLDKDDLIHIAQSPHGAIETVNRILTKQGIRIALTPQGLDTMAGFCVDTKLYARGIQLCIGSLVEEAVYNRLKTDIFFGQTEVQQAIERIISMG